MARKVRVSNGTVHKRKQNRTVEKVENTRQSTGENKHKQVVTEHAHTHSNACDTLTRFVADWLTKRKTKKRAEAMTREVPTALLKHVTLHKFAQFVLGFLMKKSKKWDPNACNLRLPRHIGLDMFLRVLVDFFLIKKSKNCINTLQELQKHLTLGKFLRFFSEKEIENKCVETNPLDEIH